MVAVYFAVTMFLGAGLLFLVQPMIGKMLLPVVGGTTGVWTACMAFFQAVLFAGYLYAHHTTRRFSPRWQAVVHAGLLLLVLTGVAISIAASGMPIAVLGSLIPEDEDDPIVAVLGVVAVAMGLPFFALATTSPLLQRWFAALGGPRQSDPYLLYAASNAGSLLGLLAYPFLIEPNLSLLWQQWLWAGGLGVYGILVTAVGACLYRNFRADYSRIPTEPLKSTLRPTFTTGQAIRVLLLAALPSSLLLSVTAFLSTDIAPVPLLWVVPLSLYLISFILVFSRWPATAQTIVGRVLPMLLLFVVLTLVTGATEPIGMVLGLHLAAFFVVCLVSHSAAAQLRPPAEELTGFYLWLSAGGVLGGMSTALLAPLIFSRLGLVEYPLALVLAALLGPGLDPGGWRLARVRDWLPPLGVFGLAAGLVILGPIAFPVPVDADPVETETIRTQRAALMYGLPVVVAFLCVRNPIRYALALAALLVASRFDTGVAGQLLYRERNFYGVVSVTLSTDGQYHWMVHGATLHGVERLADGDSPEPRSYYHRAGPVGQLFRALPSGPGRQVAVVGLGVGAVAAYAQPGDHWTFFEIDPAVVRIAQNPAYFKFLSSCRASDVTIVLGDARRRLGRIPDGSFDLIVLDAFSSDAIPVHLLTREALDLYSDKLTAHGLILAHVSNAHLDLPPVVARLAADHAPPFTALYVHDYPTEPEKLDGKAETQFMLLSRDGISPGFRKALKGWRQPPTLPGRVWTDDYVNLLSAWRRADAD